MLSGKVLVKIKGKWYKATANDDGKLTSKQKVVGNLRDIKPGYISLSVYARVHSVSKDEILKKYKVENLWIMDVKEEAAKSVSGNEKAFMKYWWKSFNKVCVSCQKECKQSSRLTVVNCPSYLSVKTA